MLRGLTWDLRGFRFGIVIRMFTVVIYRERIFTDICLLYIRAGRVTVSRCERSESLCIDHEFHLNGDEDRKWIAGRRHGYAFTSITHASSSIFHTQTVQSVIINSECRPHYRVKARGER